MKIYLTAASYLTLFCGIWFVFCSVMNSLRFRSINRKGARYHLETEPLVSVIIPARNEEKNLPRLLESLIIEDYRNIEILVADDRSTDRTGEIIAEYSEKDSRVKGLRTEEKKFSPHGKINAMLTAIEKAEGEYILCIDADTIHSEKSISSALRIMKSGDYDILSGFPEEKSSSRMAEIITSAMIFANTALPHFLTDSLHLSSFAMGIGQFIMMKKSSYSEVGGYGSLKNVICDDLEIIRLFMKKGKRYAFTVLSPTVSCRMYENGKDAFRGIERSLAGVFPLSLPVVLLLILAVILLLTVAWIPLLSPLFIIYGRTDLLLKALTGWAGMSLSWYTQSRMLHFRTVTCLSFPLAVTSICAMYLHSVFTRLRGGKFNWKGDRV